MRTPEDVIRACVGESRGTYKNIAYYRAGCGVVGFSSDFSDDFGRCWIVGISYQGDDTTYAVLWTIISEFGFPYREYNGRNGRLYVWKIPERPEA